MFCLCLAVSCDRSLQSQHAATVKQELGSWHQQQEAAAQADNAAKTNLARSTAWQLVQLAERVAEFRAATGGQAVPLADWRAWLSLFLAGGFRRESCALKVVSLRGCGLDRGALAATSGAVLRVL